MEVGPVCGLEQDLAAEAVSQAVDGGGGRAENFNPDLQLRFELR